MEDRSTIALELCDGALGAPADHDIAAAEDLSATLRLGAEVIGREVSPNQISGPGSRVEAQDLAAARRSSVHLGTIAVLGAMGAVVIQADHFDISLLLQPPGVVLEAKLGAIGHLEVGSVAIEAPDDGAISAIDLVDCTGVASGDKVVALSVLVNRVDVEVVPSVGRIVAGASLAGIDRKNSLYGQLTIAQRSVKE